MATITTISLLTDIFIRAKEAALEADPGPDSDGGTCNFDTPAFKIARMQSATIEQAAQEAGVSVTPFQWFGGSRWFWLNVPMHGQANRRTRMMEAAQRVLSAVTDVPGWKSCGYYQMD